MNGLTMHAITLVVMDLVNRGIDGDFMKIRSAQTGDLRVNIRMNAASKQGVV